MSGYEISLSSAVWNLPQLRNSDVPKLVQALECASGVEELLLYKAQLGDSGVASLVTAFNANPDGTPIVMLNIGDTGVTTASLLVDLTAALPTLRVLSFDNNRICGADGWLANLESKVSAYWTYIAC